MPTTTWSAKRECQYTHIKTSLLERGKPEPLAEEIAARVVNKERAQHGESVEASASSLHDMSASRRGGLRSRVWESHQIAWLVRTGGRGRWLGRMSMPFGWRSYQTRNAIGFARGACDSSASCLRFLTPSANAACSCWRAQSARLANTAPKRQGSALR